MQHILYLHGWKISNISHTENEDVMLISCYLNFVPSAILQFLNIITSCSATYHANLPNISGPFGRCHGILEVHICTWLEVSAKAVFC